MEKIFYGVVSMNKYENAIDVVARYCSDYRIGIFPPRNELHGELDTLNELIDKVMLMEQALYLACCELEEKDSILYELYDRYHTYHDIKDRYEWKKYLLESVNEDE